MTDRGKPLYMIGVVADMLNVHPQTLRFYEKKGLVRPSRTVGRTRMYSTEDVDELARLLRLTRDLGVNLAGIEVILKMRRRMIEMQKQIEDLVTYLREEGGETAGAQGGTRPGGVRSAQACRSVLGLKGETWLASVTRKSSTSPTSWGFCLYAARWFFRRR